ncbi:CcoQ/FixQ family Cbb3-type cytochrome c oxidase assembly chaperone [Niabella beijingensis]|uniref:CcoQ/FixQ family Cbb3-type cytochrome c oxidase assembly chaperone n=1 Tax=Niabella beijingensis TaxID=2872700 RepID=UPI001CBEB5B4|nr:CcoQ/FixQ family Cbb3-type cytochrome c oxidase assembly chaperone [Niabella beijingensis]MBZ4191060.1 CcoQ/FixQ family Cbb3-type cytochrome c oxidase assembly chaperone [Niabella beijingensis]
MKFINYLEKISGVSIYPVVSLILFTSMFVIVVLYAMKTSKERISEMEKLPLDEN